MAKKVKTGEKIWIFLIDAQNNTKWTNYIKAEINNAQNSKCKRCGKRDEAVKQITKKQMYQTVTKRIQEYAWLWGKVTHLELCKRLKFGHESSTNKSLS